MSWLILHLRAAKCSLAGLERNRMNALHCYMNTLLASQAISRLQLTAVGKITVSRLFNIV